MCETFFLCSAALLLAACSGGSGGLDGGGCTGFCATNTPTRLEVADVEQAIAQAVAEAGARGAPATIAVVDRSGNVLGVFRMNGADTLISTDGGRGVDGGLDGLADAIPDTLAAIAKAITAAYLSSEGNAFSTRTASQIVQEHFYPDEVGQPSGPLFGVQFSQLPCSDVNTRFNGVAPSAGPQRSPLGLAADPGGLPLYKNGTPVGGIGVISDGVYGLDLDIRDRDVDDDEVIALAGSSGFEAPADRRAERISAGGVTLRFADARGSDLATDPSAAPAFATIDAGVAGDLVTVPLYAANAIVAGTTFGQDASGIRPATMPALAAQDAFVLVDDANAERFEPINATDAGVTGASALSAGEVEQLLASALAVANRARAQIRRPLGTPARVTVSVVDTFGAALGIARTRDAPVFGVDVSLQKARTAAFLSNPAAAADLAATPGASYLGGGTSSIAAYVPALRAFLGLPTALADGAIAFSARATGNLARPYYPDGLAGSPQGPLSKPIAEWSPLSTGVQLDLVNNAIGQHVVFQSSGAGSDTATGTCSQLPVTANGSNRLGNGIQIFPGGVPIYRGAVLVGAIGVSGDGVDQDDMVAFLGLHEGAVVLGTGLNNAPAAVRADTLTPQGVRLRYVQCPQAPYHSSNEQNVCEGK